MIQMIPDKQFKVIVKTRAKKNSFDGYDPEKKAYKISITAVPDGYAANKEIIRFLTKLLKRKVCIKSGLRSKEKMIITE